MTGVALLIGAVMAGTALQAVPAGRPATPPAAAAARTRPCDLLSPEDIREVQGSPLKDRKSSQEPTGRVRFSQCFFAAEDFVRSVSVTVIDGNTADYWRRTFHAPEEAASGAREADERDRRDARGRQTRATPADAGEREREREEDDTPATAVGGLGEEAFWTTDERAGSLYVLHRGAILRISVGGVQDQQERLRRTKALAAAALRRLR